jgi:hypothetical protein
VKNTVFWAVTQRCSERVRRSSGIYCLYFQDLRVSQAKIWKHIAKRQSWSLPYRHLLLISFLAHSKTLRVEAMCSPKRRALSFLVAVVIFLGPTISTLCFRSSPNSSILPRRQQLSGKERGIRLDSRST